MTDNLNKNISEVLPDFFSKNQLAEFISIYESSVTDDNEKEAFQEVKHLDYKIESGLSFRSQIDLLITFSGNKLPQEKFLSLLLYLSQASITIGEFLTAIDINEKIVSLTSS